MSEISLPVTQEHIRYITEHTAGDDAFLRGLKEEARAAGLPAIWIAPEQASFIQILLKLIRARTVIDVGTLAGYSAIAMARAISKEGCVHTIEVLPLHADFAERWIAKSDVSDRILLHRGPAAEVLPRFESGSVDALLLDADKKGLPTYLREGLRLLRSGGLLLVDNAFAFGELFATRPAEMGVEEVRKFNEEITRTSEIHGIIVPLGDGLWVGVRA